MTDSSKDGLTRDQCYALIPALHIARDGTAADRKLTEQFRKAARDYPDWFPLVNEAGQGVEVGERAGQRWIDNYNDMDAALAAEALRVGVLKVSLDVALWDAWSKSDDRAKHELLARLARHVHQGVSQTVSLIKPKAAQ